MNAPLWVIIPSAGKGKRFGSSTPKQYLSLLNKPVIQHTLDRFMEREDVAGVILAVAADDTYVDSLSINHKVHIVTGGKERADSVFNALEYLEDLVSDTDLVAVHDAARPCIRKSSLDQLFEVSASSEAGAILALPVTDTVKLSEARKINKTIDRNQVWLAQTPQVFQFLRLKEALSRAKKGDTAVTDEASAIEMMGEKPDIVPGRKDNIKITNADDLKLAAYYLANILEEQD